MFVWIGQTDWFVAFVNVAVPWSEVEIGLGPHGRPTDAAGGVLRGADDAAVHFGNWNVARGPINADVMYMLVFLSVAAFGAGCIFGLDDYVEQYEVDGQPLIEKYPKHEYVLG